MINVKMGKLNMKAAKIDRVRNYKDKVIEQMTSQFARNVMEFSEKLKDIENILDSDQQNHFNIKGPKMKFNID